MFKRVIAIMLGFMLLFTGEAIADEAEKWILTQYYGGGSVGMFYSLINQMDGTVILVDGGWTANADQVREVIETNGGKVDYWFLTHYHEDHCGAFNALWSEYRDKIGIVYVTPLTWEEFEPYCRDWDTPETFKLFLEQTEGADNIKALHRGDEFDIKNLKIQIFNAWDEEILPITNDIANNCSLVFKIDTSHSTVLFLGDMVYLGDLLTDTYGIETLHADYVQAGHHGWGPAMSFYKAIQMKEMFIDADEYYLTSEEFANKHGALANWCKENEVEIHDFSKTPFSVNLE